MSFHTINSPDRNMDQNRSQPRHTIVKFQIFERKDKSLQASKEKKMFHIKDQRWELENKGNLPLNSKIRFPVYNSKFS